MNTSLWVAVAGVQVIVGLPGCAARDGESPSADVQLVMAPGSPLRVGAPAGTPGIGDLNGDQLPDLVTPAGLGTGKGARLVVLINRGGGRLEQGAEVGTWRDTPDVQLGDLNDDGKLDLVAAEHDSSDVTVMIGDGKGGFAPAEGSPFRASTGGQPHTHAVTLKDVNGDRLLDVLTTNVSEGTVSVLLADGKAGFAPATGSPFAVAPQQPYDAIAIADFSGDAIMDLAVPLLAGHDVAVLFGDGRGGFGPPTMVRVGNRPAFLETTDVNGDRKADLLVTHDDVGRVDVLLGTGRGDFIPAPGSPWTLSRPVWDLSAGDLNGDGRTDIALAENTGRNVLIALGDGEGRFKVTTRVDLGGPVAAVVLADMDGDRRLDVVCSTYEGGEVVVLLAK
jgi:hypothetical protein